VAFLAKKTSGGNSIGFWYARILQHEIDHLRGALYIDRMQSRSFCSLENYNRYWKTKPQPTCRRNLAATPRRVDLHPKALKGVRAHQSQPAKRDGMDLEEFLRSKGKLLIQ
jgi:hypothetical protein